MQLKRFFRKKKKQVFPNSKYIIEYAFTVGGIAYYKHNDVFNLPYERGLMAMAAYEECRMGVSREYLAKHTEQLGALLRETSVDIFKINTLNELLKERSNFVADTDLLYRLASIVFFDEQENPSIYEPEYASRKIKHWKEHRETLDFFLQKPLQELIPFLASSPENVQAYIQMTDQLKETLSEIALSNNFNLL